MAIHRGRSARLVRELSGLDSHGPLLEGLLGIRDQSAKRIFLKTKIKRTSVFVANQDNAFKLYTGVLGFVKKSDCPVEIIHLKTYPPALVSSFHVDD